MVAPGLRSKGFSTRACSVLMSTSSLSRIPAMSLTGRARIASEIWSAILSGCPSVTDSEVNRCAVFASPIPAVPSLLVATAPLSVMSGSPHLPLSLLADLLSQSVEYDASYLRFRGSRHETLPFATHHVDLVLVGAEAR